MVCIWITSADRELYEGLTAGKFCYVLNSRQSGKSSLRVRTMRRLRDNGVECAAIDLSAGGIQNVPPEQWYAYLIDTLIDSFGLDLDFGDWWEENQLNSLVTRFRKFLEEILLVEIQENNAIKFTHEGKIAVTMDIVWEKVAFQSRQFPGRARVHISDTGIGVSLDKQDKLFQLFSQINDSQTHRSSGTGLGLAISQKLVEAMGGEIHFYSAGEGLGSTVTFSILLNDTTHVR
jgi:light-regulated signal transduction histidine kinase (bacteriophytochrome)